MDWRRSRCVWIEGGWEEGGRGWNELEDLLDWLVVGEAGMDYECLMLEADNEVMREVLRVFGSVASCDIGKKMV